MPDDLHLRIVNNVFDGCASFADDHWVATALVHGNLHDLRVYTLRLATIADPFTAKPELTMINVNDYTLSLHMATLDTLRDFARLHGGAPDEIDDAAWTLLRRANAYVHRDVWRDHTLRAIACLTDSASTDKWAVDVNGAWVTNTKAWLAWLDVLLTTGGKRCIIYR